MQKFERFVAAYLAAFPFDTRSFEEIMRDDEIVHEFNRLSVHVNEIDDEIFDCAIESAILRNKNQIIKNLFNHIVSICES